MRLDVEDLIADEPVDVAVDDGEPFGRVAAGEARELAVQVTQRRRPRGGRAGRVRALRDLLAVDGKAVSPSAST